MNYLKPKLPGIALSVIIAAVAWLLQQAETAVLGFAVIEGLVIAIVIGMAYRNLAGVRPSAVPGVAFTAREVLEFAVLLLGASVNFPALFREGAALLIAITVAVLVALSASTVIGRALGLNPRLATLVAVGNSICGNSAIAAVAPVIKAEPEDIAASIAFTAVLGVVVVLSLPLSVALLGLSNYQYGVLAGMSVYAVPQVVAAAAQISPLSLQVATSVKLVRVLFLGPVVLFFTLRQHASAKQLKLGKLVPWFIVGFMALALLRSVGAIPAEVGATLADIGKLLTIASMAALGLGVDLKAIRKAGPRVTGAVIASLVVLIATSVALIRVFGIGSP